MAEDPGWDVFLDLQDHEIENFENTLKIDNDKLQKYINIAIDIRHREEEDSWHFRSHFRKCKIEDFERKGRVV